MFLLVFNPLIEINDSKPRRNSVMSKFLKYDLMESEAPPELLISECSQGQGDSVFFAL